MRCQQFPHTNSATTRSDRMADLKTFAPFNPATETWESYIERFECFLEANNFADLPSNRKRVYFLNFCGTEMFETARALLAPLRLGDSVGQIKETLRPNSFPVCQAPCVPPLEPGRRRDCKQLHGGPEGNGPIL